MCEHLLGFKLKIVILSWLNFKQSDVLREDLYFSVKNDEPDKTVFKHCFIL